MTATKTKHTPGPWVRLASFVDAIVGKRLTYARLIAKVPA